MTTLLGSRIHELRSPRGNRVLFECRDDTTDWMTVNACCAEDEYGVRALVLEGWAIDVGAHIGGVTIGLLADNPGLQVVAVEALPENVASLRRNLELNGFAERCVVYERAAASGKRKVAIRYGDGHEDEQFARLHRFIGGGVWNKDDSPSLSCAPVSLTAIIRDIGSAAFMKIDCEGCEWSFLADKAVEHVREIRGEYHPRDGKGPAELRRLLDQTHVVTLDDSLAFGPFTAVRR